MNFKNVLVMMVLVTVQLTAVHCASWSGVIDIATSVLGLIVDIADKNELWVVEVRNEGSHHAHMFCESADDKIGDENGLWVPPGEKIAWAFKRAPTTQFWCNMDWLDQRVGWDVFVTNWADAPNPTIWLIKDDGVYDEWQMRKWRDLHS